MKSSEMVVMTSKRYPRRASNNWKDNLEAASGYHKMFDFLALYLLLSQPLLGEEVPTK